MCSVALGVGNNPDPITPVRGTNGASGYTMPFRIIPERSERPEHSIQSARAKGADIFDEDVARLEDFDRFGVLEPESAAFAGESSAFSGKADVLAGESSTQEIDGFDGSPINCANISVSLDVRPMLGEHSLTVWVDFNLPRDVKTRSGEAKIKSSYSGEETADSQCVSHTRTPSPSCARLL